MSRFPGWWGVARTQGSTSNLQSKARVKSVSVRGVERLRHSATAEHTLAVPASPPMLVRVANSQYFSLFTTPWTLYLGRNFRPKTHSSSRCSTPHARHFGNSMFPQRWIVDLISRTQFPRSQPVRELVPPVRRMHKSWLEPFHTGSYDITRFNIRSVC